MLDTNQKNVHSFESAVNFLSPVIKEPLLNLKSDLKESAYEIRVRVQRPVEVIGKYKNEIVMIVKNSSTVVNELDIKESFNALCKYSVYSFWNQICSGFITYGKGHRVGICGRAVTEKGAISNICDITSFNIRIANQVVGCADKIFSLIKLHNCAVLIVGNPASGKTTVLRDLARLLSSKGNNFNSNVSIIDSKNEIASANLSSFGFDIGFSDVFTLYPKKDGILQALKCMSPHFIICDEIGDDEDVYALNFCVNSGVKVVATMHAGSIEELLNRKIFSKIKSMNAFEKIILLHDDFKISENFDVYDMEDIND